MALESVFAIPPPLVGAGNTETLKHGEKESSGEENSEASDGEGPPTLLPEDAEEGELEEGEIIESGEEAPDITEKTDDGAAAAEGPEAAANEADASNDAEALKKKKKKKKKKRKPDPAGNENSNEPTGQEQKDEKAKKPKRKRYVDHDRVGDESPWFRSRSPSHRRDGESPDRSPRGLYDSPYESQDELEDRQDSDEYFGGRNNNSRRPPNYKKRRGGAPHGQPDRKRARVSRFGQTKGGRRFGQSKGPTPRTICKFFLDGKCSKGSDCTFLHDGCPSKKKEVCKFYLSGYCGKGDHCLFMHKEFPCKFFHRGLKCFSNERCMFSHEPLSEEGRMLLDRYLDSYHEDEEGDFPPAPSPPPPSSLPLPPHSPNKRPSLLGSPPRHIKEMAQRENMRHMGSPPRHMNEMERESMRSMRSPPRHIKEMAERENMRKIPSLFDIKVGPPAQIPPPLSGSPNPHGGPARPNFYNDTLKISPIRMRFPPMGRRPPPPMVMNGPRPGCSPPREMDIRFQRHQSPIKEEEKGTSPKSSPSEYLTSKDVDMRKLPDSEEKPSVVIKTEKSDDEESDHSKSEEKGNSSESDSESKKITAAAPIPSHLPKRQRELFMRIQQQQREAGSSQEDSDRNDAKKEEAKEENWYSSDDSDDDDAGDQPITAVLKKLQQQPPQPKAEQAGSPPTFDIAKMLGMIRNQATQNKSPAHQPSEDVIKESAKDQDMRMGTRDPRMRRNMRQEPNPHKDKDSRMLHLGDTKRDPRLGPGKELGVEPLAKNSPQHARADLLMSPRSDEASSGTKPPNPSAAADPWGNGDKDMRQLGDYLQNSGAGLVDDSTGVQSQPLTPMPYKLYSMTVSHPNYNTIAIASQNNPKLLNDPRLQKPLTLPDIPLPLRPPAPAVNSSSNSSDSESSSKNSDPRTRRPSLNMNGLGSPPHIIGSPPAEPLLSPTILTTRADPRASASKSDPRSSAPKADPRSSAPKTDPRSVIPCPSSFPPNSDPRSFAPSLDPRSVNPNLDQRLGAPHPHARPVGMIHDPRPMMLNPDPRSAMSNFDPRQMMPNFDPRGHPSKSDSRSGNLIVDPRARSRFDPRLNKHSQPQQPPASPPPPPPPSLPPPPPPSVPHPSSMHPKTNDPHPAALSQSKPFVHTGRHAGLPSMPLPQPRERLPAQTTSAVSNTNRAASSELTKPAVTKTIKRIERHKKNSETPSAEGSEQKTSEALPKPKGGSFQRRSSLDYASPLGYNDSESSSSQPGYNSYSRRPKRTLPKPQPNTQAPKLTTQNATPVPSPPSVKSSPRPELEGPENTSSNPEASEEDLFNAALNASLKDVFKTIDPTASPFC